MKTVKHKTFGIGEVLQMNDTRLVVRFQNDGSEKIFAIPQSFRMGFLVAEGDFKTDIDHAIAKFETTQKQVSEAAIKAREEQRRETLINSLYKSRTLNMAYGYIYKLLQYDTWSEEQIKNLFDATVGASYGLKTLESDDIYSFYQELLKSENARKCSCESKIRIIDQLEYIDSNLDW